LCVKVESVSTSSIESFLGRREMAQLRQSVQVIPLDPYFHNFPVFNSEYPYEWKGQVLLRCDEQHWKL
jgi:hypothetical protein